MFLKPHRGGILVTIQKAATPKPHRGDILSKAQIKKCRPDGAWIFSNVLYYQNVATMGL